ncbi:uncharacterized protein [Epargyreus clarus]|uniref:uncharacterized protein isoform X2 n=1 Tax=Epargyreus clarus TaxID=520877 RepID=UPI003C2E08CB
MIRILLAFGVLGCLHSGLVQAQPSRCKDYSQCVKGFYCDVDTFHCRECLSCEDHKREPPRLSSACIQSVADCGPCIKGLVEDHGGENGPQCVTAIARDEGGPPAYVWAAVAVGLLLLALAVIIIVYVLRNPDTFKILASTRTSVQSPCSRSNGVSAASAPELPPSYDASCPAPYNPQYAPASPLGPIPNEYTDTPTQDDESARPFMKRVEGEGEGEGGASAAREAAGRQAARVYYPPRYVRVPNKPAGPREEPESTFTVHDEDTMESTWTPTPSVDHTDTNGNAISSEPHTAPAPSGQLLPLASHSAHTSHPLCTLQDSNNNRNTSEASSAYGEGSSHAAPSFIISVVQNINAVQQHNDVTL